MLRGLELPLEGAETAQVCPAQGCLRHIEFLNTEIEQVERLICQEALKSPQIRRLLTVPGINVICAAMFLAAVGDVRRRAGVESRGAEILVGFQLSGLPRVVCG